MALTYLVAELNQRAVPQNYNLDDILGD